VALRPQNDWEFAQALVDVLIALGDRESARAEVEMVSRLWPGRVGPIVLSARVSLSEGDPAGAEDSLLQLGGSITERPLALSLRGRARLELGRLDEAASDLDAAIAARPDLRAAVIARADVDRLRGDAKAAMTRLEPFKDDLGGDAALAVAYAGALRAGGELEKARDVLQPLIEAGRLSALLELSALERAAGRYKEAAEALDRALEINPKAIEARLGRAILDFESGKGTAAAKAIRTLVDQAPNNVHVLVEAARILSSTGAAEEADTLLTEAATTSSSLAWVVARERGRVMLRRMQPIEAISELERARSLQPGDWETRILLMEAHFSARNRRGSARALQDITKGFQNGALRPLAAGIHALASERPRDAIQELAVARDQLEKAKAAPRDVSRAVYWLGRAHEYEGSVDAAAAAFLSSTKLNPTQADAFYWLGQIDFQRGQFDAMIEHYRKAVEIDPGANPLAWSFLGHEYARRNMRKKAVESFQSFLKHWPEDAGDVVSEAKAMIAKLDS